MVDKVCCGLIQAFGNREYDHLNLRTNLLYCVTVRTYSYTHL